MATNSLPQFTASEQRTMTHAWQCFKSTPDIDYEKLGELVGTTAKSQRNAMGVIRKKLGLGGAGAPVSPAASSPAKAAKKSTPKRGTAKRKLKEMTPSDSDSWGNSPPAEWAMSKRVKKEEGETNGQTSNSDEEDENKYVDENNSLV